MMIRFSAASILIEGNENSLPLSLASMCLFLYIECVHGVTSMGLMVEAILISL